MMILNRFKEEQDSYWVTHFSPILSSLFLVYSLFYLDQRWFIMEVLHVILEILFLMEFWDGKIGILFLILSYVHNT